MRASHALRSCRAGNDVRVSRFKAHRGRGTNVAAATKAMGKRKKLQKTMWVSASELPMSPGHPFYERLNQALESEGFDRFAENLCRRFYAPVLGRPSLSPWRYFRLLLVGYFEGLDSERGIAWRAADSLAIRSFLGLELNEGAPDHSTISRTRRLIDVETHRQVFTWIQERLAVAGLLVGKTVSIDGTTLEANAAMRSIVRRETGESYQEFLTGLAKASGIKTPSREALARLDRRRKKKGSNEEWTSPSDPDAKITKMKDGRTHLAHKAEHAVDMETGAIVAVTIQGADQGDTTTLGETLNQAEQQIETVIRRTESWDVEDMQELVVDKGYHSTQTLLDLEERGIRGYVSEPDRGRRKWGDEHRRSEGGVCEPAAHSWHPRSESAASTRREGRTLVRTLVRDGPNAADPPTRSLEHSQTAPASQRRLQSRALAPHLVRCGNPAGPPGPHAGLLGALGHPHLTPESPCRPPIRSRRPCGHHPARCSPPSTTAVKMAFTTGC